MADAPCAEPTDGAATPATTLGDCLATRAMSPSAAPIEPYRALLRQIPSAASCEDLTALCIKTGVPSTLRPQIWKFLLSSSAASATWDGRLNRADQPDIHAAASTEPMMNGLPEGSVERLERVITCYCSSTGTPFRSALTPLAAPLVRLSEMSELDAFSCLSGLLSRFMPHLCDHDPKVIEGVNELFRLLLYYVDPQLAFYIQQRGVQPQHFTFEWFSSLFSRICTPAALARLWDVYILHNNPLLFAYLAAALLISVREELLKITATQEIVARVAALRFETPDSVDALLRTAYELCTSSPVSFRKQLTSAMRNTEHFRSWIYPYICSALCLHISAVDIAAERVKGKAFFVIDCRPASHFEQGYLPTAYSLPLSLAIEDPEAFDKAVDGLKGMQQGGDELHWTICGVGGHGPAADGAGDLNTIVVRLLKRGFKHLSVIHRGFLSCHEQFAAGRLDLASHTPEHCRICTPPESTLNTGDVLAVIATEGVKKFAEYKTSWLSSLSKMRSQAATAVEVVKSQRLAQQQQQQQPQLLHANEKQPQPQTGSQPTVVKMPATQQLSSSPGDALSKGFAAMHSLMRPRSDSGGPKASSSDKISSPIAEKKDAAPTHASPAEPKKSQDSTNAPVPAPDAGLFTIDDEDEEDDPALAPPSATTTASAPAASASQEADLSGYSPLAEWVGAANAVCWECTAANPADGKPAPGKNFLVLNQEHFICLECHQNDATHAKLKLQHPLSALDKIALKKSVPRLLIFRFSGASEQAFLLDDPSDVVRAVRERVERLRDNATEEDDS